MAASGLTDAQQTEFSQFVDKELKLPWWHWVGNVWLVTTRDESFDIERLSSKIGNMSSNERWLVMELHEDIDWRAGGATNSKGSRLYDWIRDTWGKE